MTHITGSYLLGDVSVLVIFMLNIKITCINPVLNYILFIIAFLGNIQGNTIYSMSLAFVEI